MIRTEQLIKLRNMTEEEWIDKHASGTLRKNKRIGMNWKEQYLHERTAWEFGWTFDVYPINKIRVSPLATMGDSKAITEAGWFFDRFLERWPYEDDKFSIRSIHFGDNLYIGIVVESTSVNFIPFDRIVIGIISKFNKETGEFEEASNPF